MKKNIWIVLICILLISVFFLGKRLGTAEGITSVSETTITENSTERNLRISVVPCNGMGFTSVPLEHGNYKDISYLDVNNVTIDIDGTSMQLEDALLDGDISVDELISYARQDASLGLCREVAKSKNGLTVFTYYYGDFSLRFVYDIYETPDGRQHLITDFLIYGAWCEPRFLPVDKATGDFIDYENWGLSFEISKLDPSGITIECFQSGGQQMGELNVGQFLLFRKNTNTLDLDQVHPLVEDGESVPLTVITMGGATELSFDFAGLYGELPAGDYVLSLQILDYYNKDEVPSLMRNYHDEQWYEIEYTIE